MRVGVGAGCAPGHGIVCAAVRAFSFLRPFSHLYQQRGALLSLCPPLFMLTYRTHTCTCTCTHAHTHTHTFSFSLSRTLSLTGPHATTYPCMCLHTQTKHMERFAIRAKYMTLEPRLNKYVHYFANIRTIQCHLVAEAAAAHVRTYIDTLTHARTHAHTYICTYAHTHTHAHAHAHARTRSQCL
jgi:hypothetical protein